MSLTKHNKYMLAEVIVLCIMIALHQASLLNSKIFYFSAGVLCTALFYKFIGVIHFAE